MGFVANMVSLVLYFLYVMYFNSASASNTLTNLMGSTFLLTLVGGFVSDTYISRLSTCLIFGSLEVIVIKLILLVLVLVVFMIPESHCSHSCTEPSSTWEDLTRT